MSLPFRPGYEKFTPTHNGYFYPDNSSSVIIKNLGSDYGEGQGQATRKLFDELLSQYGIEVVPFSLVQTGKNLRNTSLFAVSDKIDGDVIDYVKSPDSITENQHLASVALNNNLITYLDTKVTSGEGFLGDIYGTHQYLYTPDEKLVLVDLDPFIEAPRNNKAPNTDPDRVRGELMRFGFILEQCNIISKHDSSLVEQWDERSHQLLDNICQVNDITFPESDRSAIFQAFKDSKSDDLNELFESVLRSPENQHLK